MKHEDRKNLLEDLYPGGGGPPVEEVLGMLRRDRSVRRRRKLAALAGAALVIVGATLVALQEAPLMVTPPAQVAKAKVSEVQAPEAVERISDEELLAAMGQPAALVTLPDGRQRVLYLAPVGHWE